MLSECWQDKCMQMSWPFLLRNSRRIGRDGTVSDTKSVTRRTIGRSVVKYSLWYAPNWLLCLAVFFFYRPFGSLIPTTRGGAQWRIASSIISMARRGKRWLLYTRKLSMRQWWVGAGGGINLSLPDVKNNKRKNEEESSFFLYSPKNILPIPDSAGTFYRDGRGYFSSCCRTIN